MKLKMRFGLVFLCSMLHQGGTKVQRGGHMTRPARPGGLCPARAGAAAFQFVVRAPDHSQTTHV